MIQKKAKFKELWENIGLNIGRDRSKSLTELSTSKEADSKYDIKQNTESNKENLDLNCFSDFEEDEMLLSLDVDAVIQNSQVIRDLVKF